MGARPGTTAGASGTPRLTDDGATAISAADGATTLTPGAITSPTAAGQGANASGGQGQGNGQGATGQQGDTVDVGASITSAARRGPATPAAPTTSVDAQTAAVSATGVQNVQQAAPAAEIQTSTVTPLPVADQIADGVLQASRRTGQSVQVILQPEGLGTVSLRVSVERAGLGIHIAVDNPVARDMVHASWQQLHQSLDQRGLSVQSMFLDLAGRQGGGEAFQQFQQFNGQQFNGQQASGGSSSTVRRDDVGVTPLDEEPRSTSGVGSTSRVDYRI